MFVNYMFIFYIQNIHLHIIEYNYLCLNYIEFRSTVHARALSDPFRGLHLNQKGDLKGAPRENHFYLRCVQLYWSVRQRLPFLRLPENLLEAPLQIRVSSRAPRAWTPT